MLSAHAEMRFKRLGVATISLYMQMKDQQAAAPSQGHDDMKRHNGCVTAM